MNNDALNNIKKLRDVLNEAIAAMESGREVRVEEKHPCDVVTWHEVAVFRDRDYRCVIKPREIWVNEYPYGTAAIHHSLEEAEGLATPDRIRCTRFVEAMDDEHS
jgi:hypothetical protein